MASPKVPKGAVSDPFEASNVPLGQWPVSSTRPSLTGSEMDHLRLLHVVYITGAFCPGGDVDEHHSDFHRVVVFDLLRPFERNLTGADDGSSRTTGRRAATAAHSCGI